MTHFQDRRNVLRRGDIGDGAKLLAVYVLDLQGLKSGACTMTNARLAADLDCTTRAVQRRIVDLEWVGLLTQDEGPPRRLRIDVPKDAWTLPKRRATPASPPPPATSPPHDTSVAPPRHQRHPIEEQLEEQEENTGTRAPEFSQNRERGVTDIYTALRTEFYKAWRAHYPEGNAGHQPRPMGPQQGHAMSVCGWLYDSTNGDVGRARNGARMLVAAMFKNENMYRGQPWMWKSVAANPNRFFTSPSNPSRMKTETANAKRFEASMKSAERNMAPPHVGAAALAALKALGGFDE